MIKTTDVGKNTFHSALFFFAFFIIIIFFKFPYKLEKIFDTSSLDQFYLCTVQCLVWIMTFHLHMLWGSAVQFCCFACWEKHHCPLQVWIWMTVEFLQEEFFSNELQSNVTGAVYLITHWFPMLHKSCSMNFYCLSESCMHVDSFH